MATIDQVLSAGNLILRQELRDFEAHFAEYIGTRYAVGVNSGFDALHLAMRAIGFQPSDEIITVSHTCIATVGAIVNAGATPILVDVADDCNMDLDAFERAISPSTRAVVPVHLDGRPCDMEHVTAIARRHDILVIEDAAQAAGACFDGRPVGSFGIVGCFSLYPFKMLGAFGDAGIVTTNDVEIATKLRYLRDYGQNRETGDIHAFGFNARLDNLQAAILDVKLPHLEQWIVRRREIAAMYNAGLSGVGDLLLPEPASPRFGTVVLNYIIRTAERDALRRALADAGIETLISLARPIHHHPALGLQKYHLPKTDEIARTYMCLPIYPELTDSQVTYVIDSIAEFFSQSPARITKREAATTP
jgi:dTDP-4-amino-4,6-dideoxygalactose transaminase